MIQRIETERLEIVAKTISEMEQYCEAEKDPEMKKAYGEMLQGMKDLPEDWLWFSDWSIYLKGTDTIIGGMAYKGPANLEGEVEIGYGLDDDYQGKGYAYEALTKMVEWAFKDSKVEAVMAETLADNKASQKLLKKVGFRDVGIIGSEGPRFRMDMRYQYCTKVRENDKLRDSFNALTRKVFCFDFEEWYQKGFWTDNYTPHVLLDGDKVISNISVNKMPFIVDGKQKLFLQLGTVMTDPDYRGQGLNRIIMEHIKEEFRGKVDGIFLFGNDSVLEYYPRFGFQAANEYEYSVEDFESYNMDKAQMNSSKNCEVEKYDIVKYSLREQTAEDKLYQKIKETWENGINPNQNLDMVNNLGLYQFWLMDEYREDVYYLPGEDTYVLMRQEEDTLFIYQIIGNKEINLSRLAAAFGEECKRIKLGFMPAKPQNMSKKIHKEEDCTLFVMGEDILDLTSKEIIFPVICHA